jgi:hypothetical protein
VDEEQMEFIRNKILTSDYYVLVVAGKYGSTGEDSVSFTENEYDFAVANGKPVMTFLFKDLGELRGSQIELDPETREKLVRFREKISKSRLVKPYLNSDELKTLVWQARSHAFQLSPREGWVRAKNLRRIEDLEEITGLQKRVMELEAELTRVRAESAADPRRSPARGDDKVEWTVGLSSRQGRGGSIPMGQFLVRTSWTALLVALFGEGVTSLHEFSVYEAIQSHLVNTANEEPDVVLDSDDLAAVTKAVCVQFPGLNLIEVGSQAGGSTWVSNVEGRLQVARAVGKSRSESQVQRAGFGGQSSMS